MKCNKRWILTAAITASVLADGHAHAQESGQPGRGLVLARQICAECHAVDEAQARSPNLAAPRFEAVANVSGMTALALTAALQTSHSTMPNVLLDTDDLRNIVGYILALKRVN